MKSSRFPRFLPAVLALAFALGTGSLHAQVLSGTENGEWRYLGGPVGHTRYSPLTQINRDNLSLIHI